MSVITAPHSAANSFPNLQRNLQKPRCFAEKDGRRSSQSQSFNVPQGEQIAVLFWVQQCGGRSPQLNSSCSLTRQRKPGTWSRSIRPSPRSTRSCPTEQTPAPAVNQTRSPSLHRAPDSPNKKHLSAVWWRYQTGS